MSMRKFYSVKKKNGNLIHLTTIGKQLVSMKWLKCYKLHVVLTSSFTQFGQKLDAVYNAIKSHPWLLESKTKYENELKLNFADLQTLFEDSSLLNFLWTLNRRLPLVWKSNRIDLWSRLGSVPVSTYCFRFIEIPLVHSNGSSTISLL